MNPSGSSVLRASSRHSCTRGRPSGPSGSSSKKCAARLLTTRTTPLYVAEDDPFVHRIDDRQQTVPDRGSKRVLATLAAVVQAQSRA